MLYIASGKKRRIVYEIHEEEVLVVEVNVAPRGEVYR
jgi:mRNA-degrading endonuclease RelE of RelBE toxin-antitoxin system